MTSEEKRNLIVRGLRNDIKCCKECRVKNNLEAVDLIMTQAATIARLSESYSPDEWTIINRVYSKHHPTYMGQLFWNELGAAHESIVKGRLNDAE